MFDMSGGLNLSTKEQQQHMSLHKSLSMAVVLSLLCIALAWPQTNVGQISGKIFDSSGAVVPKCTITATNNETGLRQSANTDDSGNYSFPSLPSGAYTVRAEAQGFKPIEQSGVILDAATRRAVDFTLALGSITEVVSVAAAAQQLRPDAAIGPRRGRHQH